MAMYYAFFKKIIRNSIRVDLNAEYYTISGSLLTLLVFSLSGFQLPHYTNIIFPLLAILTADWIYRTEKGSGIRYYKIAQYITIVLLVALLVTIHIFFRPRGISVTAILALLITGLMIVVFLRYPMQRKWRIFYQSAFLIILVNFYLNLVFYPELLKYQSGSMVARYANHQLPEYEIRTLGVLSFTIHFHANNEVRDRKIPALKEELSQKDYLIFTSETYLDSLRMSEIEYDIIAEFDHYHTTMVTGSFLNHKTRKNSLRRHFLLKSGPGYLP